MDTSELIRKSEITCADKGQKNVLFDDLNPNREDDVYIDSDIAPLVRTVNNSESMSTGESCSGTFSDHFDVELLREQSSFEQVSSFMYRDAGYVSARLPYTFLSTPAFLHSFNDDGSVLITDASKFYTALQSALTVKPASLDKHISWQVDLNLSTETYHFTIPMKIERYMLSEANSFDEYDSYTLELIDALENAVVTLA